MAEQQQIQNKILYRLLFQMQCVPKKGCPLKSSASAACSNLNALNPFNSDLALV